MTDATEYIDEAAHRNTVDEDDARGTISIAPNVLLELIELTVRNVDGLIGLAPASRKSRRRMLPIQQPEGDAVGDTKGKSYERGSVGVRIDGDRIIADVAIVVGSGTNVPRLGQAIQERIGLAVERMLGMTVTDVNVHVAEITPDGGSKDETSP